MNRRSKTLIAGFLGAIFISSAISSMAFAEEAKPSGSTSFWEKTKVMGTTDVNYNYNFGRPTVKGLTPATNGYRVFDANANSFSIGLVELALENAPNDWVTIRTDLDFGHDAQIVQGSENWVGAVTSSFNLQQAYVALKAANIGNGITFKVGKFVTMHGNEVIEASANNNISRSFLFNYAIPFTHTGVMANYAFNDWLSLDLGVVNGWNNVVDINNGKSVHSMFTIKPTDKITWVLVGTFGPESTGNDGTIRSLIDTTITYVPNDMWTLAINYDLGRDSALAALAAPGVKRGIADWQGVAAYAHVKPFDFFGLSLRGEYFKDDALLSSAGAALAAPTVASTKVFEGTATAHFYLSEGLDLRFEYRHDHGNKASFAKGSGTAKTYQNTLASQLVYSF